MVYIYTIYIYISERIRTYICNYIYIYVCTYIYIYNINKSIINQQNRAQPTSLQQRNIR